MKRGDVVRTIRGLRPGKYANKRGVIVRLNEGEIGVDFDGDGRADAWFKPGELLNVKASQSLQNGAGATQAVGVGESVPENARRAS